MYESNGQTYVKKNANNKTSSSASKTTSPSYTSSGVSKKALAKTYDAYNKWYKK